jgi:hypothetical protein
MSCSRQQKAIKQMTAGLSIFSPQAPDGNCRFPKLSGTGRQTKRRVAAVPE